MPPAEGAAPGAHLWVFSDGASRGNPGPSGAGWTVRLPEGAQVAAGGLYLGRRTNNEAEYLAAAMGLQAALDLGAQAVTLHADSELVVRQLTGRYQVRHPRVLPLHARVVALAATVPGGFAVRHIPRADNHAADAEANAAIDRHFGRGGALPGGSPPC